MQKASLSDDDDWTVDTAAIQAAVLSETVRMPVLATSASPALQSVVAVPASPARTPASKSLGELHMKWLFLASIS